MIVLQPALFYALFTLMVKLAVDSNALNGLYFYLSLRPQRDCGRQSAVRHRKYGIFIILIRYVVLAITLIL